MTPWNVTHQVPLSVGLFRQEYWSELLFPPPGDLPNPGIEPRSPALQVDSLLQSHQGNHFLPLSLFLTEFFLQWDIKNLSFIKSWDQAYDLLEDHEFKSQAGAHSFSFTLILHFPAFRTAGNKFLLFTSHSVYSPFGMAAQMDKDTHPAALGNSNLTQAKNFTLIPLTR